MGAFGRLWNRAPIWRRTFYITGVIAALAALYPPPWLGGVVPAMRQQLASVEPSAQFSRAEPSVPSPATPPVQDIAARPPAAAPPKPPDNLPQPGGFYSGRYPLGGQSIPLPPGRWLAVATQSGMTAAGIQGVSVLLAFILDGRLVAAAIVSGSIAPEPRQAGFPAPLEAQIPAFYYRRVFSAIDHDKVDFWVSGFTQPSNWTDAFRQSAAEALRKQSISIPDRFDSAVFRLADKRNWLSAEFMFPAPATETAPARGWIEAASLADSVALSHAEKVRRWGKSWHEVMRRAFEGAPPAPNEARIAMP